MSDEEIHTEEWARQRAHPFVARYTKTPHDPKRCCASVTENSRFYTTHQCNRAPKVWYGTLGYCGQHDPDAVEKRRSEKYASWQAESKRMQDRAAEVGRVARMEKAALVAIKEIAHGHNDPRSLAISVLREHGEDTP